MADGNKSSDSRTVKLNKAELCPDEMIKEQEAAFARDIERLKARRSEFVAVTCPACGSGGKNTAFTKFTFDYVKCDSCRTIYMSPRPSPAVMGDYYANSENYKFWAEYIFPATEANRREKINRPWLMRIVDYCEQFSIPRGVLLEIGPGFGTFSALAASSGQFKQVLAVEPTPEMAQACRQRGVNVIQKRIEDIGDDEIPAADVVVSFEVVEHLFEPKIFFKQAARRIRKGGLLVVSCPNGMGFDVQMLKDKALVVDPEHVNFFNPRSLSQLAESCGYSVLIAHTPGRLDAEYVHEAIVKGELDVSADPFLKRVLLDEWDSLGWPFQQFLAANGLSSHMWMAARKN